jgi:hypothetical protein
MPYSSRTARLTYLTCPRKRYLINHYNQTGITGVKLNLDLTVGACVHKGLEVLLIACKDNQWIENDYFNPANQAIIQNSVDAAIAEFEKLLGIYKLGSPDLDYTLGEQCALIEYCIRVFAIFRLPTFLEFYEILEVEVEDIYHFKKPLICNDCDFRFEDFQFREKLSCPNCGSLDISNPFQIKADGLLRNRVNNSLVILSFKTASGFMAKTERDILHDMQGVSEWVGILDRINYYYDKMMQNKGVAIVEVTPSNLSLLRFIAYCIEQNIKPEISGVQYEYIIKGSYKEEPYQSGFKKQQNSFIRPYKFDSIRRMGSNETIAATYKWKVNSGKQPKGWNRINIWEDIGVAKFLELLATGEVQPEEGNPFEYAIVSPLVTRNDGLAQGEFDRWIRQTYHAELKVADDVKFLNDIQFEIQNLGIEDFWRHEEFQSQLDRTFPQNTQNCHNFYGKDCPFVPICHENLSPSEGLNMGLYMIRKPHHDLEKKFFESKGWIEKEDAATDKDS